MRKRSEAIPCVDKEHTVEPFIEDLAEERVLELTAFHFAVDITIPEATLDSMKDKPDNMLKIKITRQYDEKNAPISKDNTITIRFGRNIGEMICRYDIGRTTDGVFEIEIWRSGYQAFFPNTVHIRLPISSPQKPLEMKAIEYVNFLSNNYAFQIRSILRSNKTGQNYIKKTVVKNCHNIDKIHLSSLDVEIEKSNFTKSGVTHISIDKGRHLKNVKVSGSTINRLTINSGNTIFQAMIQLTPTFCYQNIAIENCEISNCAIYTDIASKRISFKGSKLDSNGIYDTLNDEGKWHDVEPLKVIFDKKVEFKSIPFISIDKLLRNCQRNEGREMDINFPIHPRNFPFIKNKENSKSSWNLLNSWYLYFKDRDQRQAGIFFALREKFPYGNTKKRDIISALYSILSHSGISICRPLIGLVIINIVIPIVVVCLLLLIDHKLHTDLFGCNVSCLITQFPTTFLENGFRPFSAIETISHPVSTVGTILNYIKILMFGIQGALNVTLISCLIIALRWRYKK